MRGRIWRMKVHRERWCHAKVVCNLFPLHREQTLGCPNQGQTVSQSVDFYFTNTSYND